MDAAEHAAFERSEGRPEDVVTDASVGLLDALLGFDKKLTGAGRCIREGCCSTRVEAKADGRPATRVEEAPSKVAEGVDERPISPPRC